MLFQPEILPSAGKSCDNVFAKKHGLKSSGRLALPWVIATTLSAEQITSLGPILSAPYSKIASTISS